MTYVKDRADQLICDVSAEHSIFLYIHVERLSKAALDFFNYLWYNK